MPEKYVMIVQDMYEGARTRVKSSVGLTDMIPVGVEELRKVMEDRGLKINRKKTVYLRCNVDGNLGENSDINIQGNNLERVIAFKYLGATLADNGDLDAEMTHRIQSG